MKLAKNTHLKKFISATVIITSCLFFLACDEKKDNSSSNLLLMLLGGGSSKLVLYNAGTHDGDLKGAEADARTGADAICNASGNKPFGATNIHAFISISGTDGIASMPANYGYAIDEAIYGPDGTTKIGDNWSDLLDATIDNTLVAAGVFSDVEKWWSGSDFTGNCASSFYCNGFASNSNSYTGEIGWSNMSTGDWLAAMGEFCNLTTIYVLCIGEK
jgi:hypothetical protein